MSQELKEYKRIRISKNLLKAETVLGVDIVGFVFNLLIGLFVTFVCKLFYMGFFFLFTHFILRRICKKDPQIITIFLKSYLKEPKIYYKG